MIKLHDLASPGRKNRVFALLSMDKRWVSARYVNFTHSRQKMTHEECSGPTLCRASTWWCFCACRSSSGRRRSPRTRRGKPRWRRELLTGTETNKEIGFISWTQMERLTLWMGFECLRFIKKEEKLADWRNSNPGTWEQSPKLGLVSHELFWQLVIGPHAQRSNDGWLNCGDR